MSHKVDLNTERSVEQWKTLLECVKINSENVLTKEEQDYYVKQIEYKLGFRNRNIEILKSIEESAAEKVKFD